MPAGEEGAGRSQTWGRGRGCLGEGAQGWGLATCVGSPGGEGTRGWWAGPGWAAPSGRGKCRVPCPRRPRGGPGPLAAASASPSASPSLTLPRGRCPQLFRAARAPRPVTSPPSSSLPGCFGREMSWRPRPPCPSPPPPPPGTPAQPLPQGPGSEVLTGRGSRTRTERPLLGRRRGEQRDPPKAVTVTLKRLAGSSAASLARGRSRRLPGFFRSVPGFPAPSG